MDSDERDIVSYLKSWSGQYVSGREIARKAAGRRRYDKEPDWAVPVLARLVEKGVVETDASAHFQLVPESKQREKRLEHVAAEIKKMTEEAGDDFAGGIEIDEPDSKSRS